MTFQQLSDGFEVAVAAGDETEIVNLPVLQTESDFTRADKLRSVGVGFHVRLSSGEK